MKRRLKQCFSIQHNVNKTNNYQYFSLEIMEHKKPTFIDGNSGPGL